MKTKCDYQIFVGLGNSRLKTFFLRRKIISGITSICKKQNVGFSLFKAFGGYTGKSSYVFEQSLVVFVMNASEDAVRQIAIEVRKSLRQESVVFCKVTAYSELIDS